MLVPDQIPDGGVLEPKGHLACRRALETHLLLDVGGVDTVPLPEIPVLIHQVLGNHEQRESLGPRNGAVGSGEDQVDDVVGCIVLTTGDEPLDAFDVPGAVAHVDRLRGGGPDVGAGIRLGEDHRPRPLLVDPEPCQLFLRLGPLFEQHPGEQRSTRVPGDGGVGRKLHLLGGPGQTRGHRRAVHLGGEGETVPATLLVDPDPGEHRLRQMHLAVLEYERDPVLVDVGCGELLAGQALDLEEDVTGCALVDRIPVAAARVVLNPVDLEEIELEVSEIRLVVAHWRVAPGSRHQSNLNFRSNKDRRPEVASALPLHQP